MSPADLSFVTQTLSSCLNHLAHERAARELAAGSEIGILGCLEVDLIKALSILTTARDEHVGLAADGGLVTEDGDLVE